MGKLFQPLNDLLGTQSKVRLLRVLANAAEGVSGREAARLAGISPMPAKRALDELVATGAVRRRILGAQHLFRLNREHELVSGSLLPLFSYERGWVERIFQVLADHFQHWSEAWPIEGAYVFGSAARGDDQPDSDFDLLAVVQHSADKQAVFNALIGVAPDLEMRFGLRLSIVVLAANDICVQAEGQLVQDVLREGRVIFGEHLGRIIHGSQRPS